MYIKAGNMCQKSTDGKPIIKNLKGQSYEVSYIAAYIWSSLDGVTPLNKVKEELLRIGEINLNSLENCMEHILKELFKVELIYRKNNEARC